MINSVTLQGRLAIEPELRTTDKGTELCQFNLAVERKPDKNKEKKTDFIACTVFGATAKLVNNYFSKGQMMVLKGSLCVERYKGKDGSNKTYTYVNVEEVAFGGDKATKKEEPKPVPKPVTVPVNDFDVINDDEGLPF